MYLMHMLICFLCYTEKLRSTEKSKDVGNQFALNKNIWCGNSTCFQRTNSVAFKYNLHSLYFHLQ